MIEREKMFYPFFVSDILINEIHVVKSHFLVFSHLQKRVHTKDGVFCQISVEIT